ncbi:hypothetical protein TNCV_1682641 [Trichonephila clavipes]|nr:hypothetical protein TNCV_1682641 [Trichonephila clavipes]
MIIALSPLGQGGDQSRVDREGETGKGKFSNRLEESTGRLYPEIGLAFQSLWKHRVQPNFLQVGVHSVVKYSLCFTVLKGGMGAIFFCPK